MTQEDAAKTLWYCFYEPVDSKIQIDPNTGKPEQILMFRNDSGKPILPNKATSEQLKQHRDKLIGKDFRFTWPDLPAGARYL